MATGTVTEAGARAPHVRHMARAGAGARDPLALLRLFHLVSPALPVGAYAYSQGLEYATHAGWVHDEPTTLAWLEGLAAFGLGTLDLPILKRLHVAWSAGMSAGAILECPAPGRTRELGAAGRGSAPGTLAGAGAR